MLKSFLNNISHKKQYLKSLKNKNNSLFVNENVSTKNSALSHKYSQLMINDSVHYIIDITFLPSNSFLHIMSSCGKVLFFCSAGSMGYTGRSKKSKYLVLKEFYKILLTKKMIFNKTISTLHLKNAGSIKFRVIKTLKRLFFIKSVRVYNCFPYNGCKKRKVKRKKFKKMKMWPSG